MVRGIDKFKEYFEDYAGQYVFIGGAACDILLGNMGVDFRSTKDLDIVLLIEALNGDFVNTFICFIESGGYEHIDKGTGENQFFRFSKPRDITFPHMIELFSKKPDYIESIMSRLSPIHISDDVMSLSAILLDEAYYNLLRTGVTVVDKISVLNLEYIILFKMKAWLDLIERKNCGEKIDSKDIKKHKNDVFRLAVNLENDARVSISGQVKKDAEKFMQRAKVNPLDLKNLGIRNILYEELVKVLEECYGIE
ncbi:hypothetical protein ABXS75_13890 [Roseburia hominis]